MILNSSPAQSLAEAPVTCFCDMFSRYSAADTQAEIRWQDRQKKIRKRKLAKRERWIWHAGLVCVRDKLVCV